LERVLADLTSKTRRLMAQCFASAFGEKVRWTRLYHFPKWRTHPLIAPMHLIIQRDRSIAPFALGSTRDQIRALLKDCELTTQPMELENGFYTQEGLVLGYTSDDRLEFIEVFSPSTAEFLGIALVNSPTDVTVVKLGELDLKPAFHAGCIRFDDIGLSLFAPGKRIESVSVYRDGYYAHT
jgi:hypothetical protein